MDQDIIEQRIAIVKDVLELIKLINVGQGMYVYHGNFENLDHNASLRDSMTPSFLRECKTCAVGSMFLGYVRLYNKATVRECNWIGHNFDSRYIPDPLKRIFGVRELAIIEAAFEGRIFGNKTDEFEDHEVSFINHCGLELCNKYSDSKMRLKYICKNIIRNKGSFKFPRDITRKVNSVLKFGRNICI